MALEANDFFHNVWFFKRIADKKGGALIRDSFRAGGFGFFLNSKEYSKRTDLPSITGSMSKRNVQQCSIQLIPKPKIAQKIALSEWF